MKTLTKNFEMPMCNDVKKWEYGENWPVVYIIHNNQEAYVGETTSAYLRMTAHLKDDRRRDLEKIHFITDSDFNKSVTLDIESSLIKYLAADEKFKLQNGNGGVQSHNFYNKENYRLKFETIWNDLRRRKIATKRIIDIENSDIFKYSPYKTLTLDQYMVAKNILDDVMKNINEDNSSITIVDGGAGTGKTVLGIYLMKLFVDLINFKPEFDDDSHMLIEGIEEVKKLNLKIGLVVPMKSLRKTLKKVFKKVHGLDVSMVISPNECVKEFYDLLIVDEAHRLRRRVNLVNYKIFDQNNLKLGLDGRGTELDWIIKSSKHQILFYDSYQTVRPTDIRPENLFFDDNVRQVNNYKLESQLRCLGGNDYVRYIFDILHQNPLSKKSDFEPYDFQIFDDLKEMTESIKQMDIEHGLCRNVAGYSWNWITKGKPRIFDQQGRFLDGSVDILIEGYGYIWNSKDVDWVNSDNSINEIGCIHTIQGYDLNYAGVIIGNELKFDKQTKKIYVDRNHYFDRNGLNNTTDDELHEYIINIYTTLLTRGIKGTYVYACDHELRQYLKKYIKNSNG